MWYRPRMGAVMVEMERMVCGQEPTGSHRNCTWMEYEEGSKVTPEDLEGRAHKERAGVSVEVTGSAMLSEVPVGFPCQVIHQPVRNLFLELWREARAKAWRLLLRSGDTVSKFPSNSKHRCLSDVHYALGDRGGKGLAPALDA